MGVERRIGAAGSKRTTYIDDPLIHESAPAQSPIKGLYLAISRDKIPGPDVGVLRERVASLRDEAKACWVVEFVKDELDDFVCSTGCNQRGEKVRWAR